MRYKINTNIDTETDKESTFNNNNKKMVGVVKDFVLLVVWGAFGVCLHSLIFVLSPIMFFMERVRAKPQREFRCILITGGNSGLGEGLADAFAGEGVRLVLTARNEDRLLSVKAKCERKGATVITASIDVTDKRGMKQLIERMDNDHPFDLVIANAGVSAKTMGATHDILEPMYNINVNGVMNTLTPIIPRMVQRQKGQIAIVSSVAGYAVLPDDYEYHTSKGAVRGIGEGMRAMLRKSNVGVSVICPGYVRSAMTDETRKSGKTMPFFMETKPAIDIMVDGLRRDVGIITFPFPLDFFAHFLESTHPVIRTFIQSFLSKERVDDKYK